MTALLAARVAARLALVAAFFSSGDNSAWSAGSFFAEDGVTENLSSGGLWNHHTGQHHYDPVKSVFDIRCNHDQQSH